MKQCYTLTGLDVLGKIRSYIRLLTVILYICDICAPGLGTRGGEGRLGYR